ncbi:MAG: hypothetical protein C6Y22_14545 [Hapalosiphonaceae cyanobacterium JJU2]|nr:MAG: hypothetical protein C6Y22_14545 [Hapalosiphonaceae cyanobacterium JJU2]
MRGWCKISPRLVIPDLRGIRQAVSYGLGFSVLPDYLCNSWIENHCLTLVIKPVEPVTNQIWLAFRKSDRQVQKTKILLQFLEQKSRIKNSCKATVKKTNEQ